MTPDAQQPEPRIVIIREPHKATALTDGWLCFKYLDNGEESLSTFADISKGDVITYSRPHTHAPAPEQFLTVTVGECMTQCLKARADERERLLDELVQMIKDNDMDKSDSPYFIHTSTINGFIKALRQQEQHP